MNDDTRPYSDKRKLPSEQRKSSCFNSEGQETGAIAPVPKNARKKI
jgi:hypothetical protein